jgi:hypothetical protein
MDFIYAPKYHWGNALWSYIHSITIISHPKKVSDDEERNKSHREEVLEVIMMDNKFTIERLKALKALIVCPRCLSTYIVHLEYLDTIDVNEEMVLFKWGVDLHNEVNKKLGKPIFTYNNALEMWTHANYYWREYNKEIITEPIVTEEPSIVEERRDTVEPSI